MDAVFEPQIHTNFTNVSGADKRMRCQPDAVDKLCFESKLSRREVGRAWGYGAIAC